MTRLVPLYVLEKLVLGVPVEAQRSVVYAELLELMHDGYCFICFAQLSSMSPECRTMLLPYMVGRTNLIAVATAAYYREV